MVAAASVIPARSAVPQQYTWNAESVFADRAAWEVELKQLMDEVPGLARFQGHLDDSPVALLDFRQAYEAVYRRVVKVFFYANMSQAVESTDQQTVAMAGQAAGLYGLFASTIAFAEPELLAMGQDKLSAWMNQEPRLAVYKQYADNLFRRQSHVRSAEVEAILGMAIEPFAAVENTSDMLINADLIFKPAASSSGETLPITQGTQHKLLASPDREVRRTAWENYADGYLAFKNTLASNLTASIKRDIFYARARNYTSSLEASLFENNIPPQVFHNLIDTYRKHIPTWHRYWAVRRKALGVDALHPYDIWAPLTKDDSPVSYEQSVAWIAEGLKPLGDEYVTTLRRGCLEERWVDVYPNLGKREGAFSYGTPDTHPFIMMSYNDHLSDLSTLAHELGHSMHSYLSWKNQHVVYSNYSLFVAEVASNFNQAMVRAHLMKQNPDPNFQIALIEEAMGNIHRYFFIMPTLARFELEVHQRAERGQGLTADSMIDLMADLFSEGYGSEMHVDRQRVGITWAQFGHLYAAYYVYQYATGISAAHALAGRILAGTSGAAENYLKFLSTGSALYPLDALKLAGVDMTTPQAVEETFAVLAGYVNRLEQLTAK
jgi:oligoendopeptidase F